MFRTQAVEQLLLEDIAGVGRPESPPGGDGEATATRRVELDRSRRRALTMVALDWLAIVVLLVARARSGPAMLIGPTEDSVLAIGLLAIATHSGFRLGQLEKLGAVKRALSELAARSRSSTESAGLD